VLCDEGMSSEEEGLVSIQGSSWIDGELDEEKQKVQKSETRIARGFTPFPFLSLKMSLSASTCQQMQ
jgi:hypothetical protein